MKCFYNFKESQFPGELNVDHIFYEIDQLAFSIPCISMKVDVSCVCMLWIAYIVGGMYFLHGVSDVCVACCVLSAVRYMFHVCMFILIHEYCVGIKQSWEPI